ncbi:MAG: NAD(P)H-dependent oxidoreductase subunit E [Pirellulales bacterium]
MVCRDMACHLRGSDACKRALERRAAELNAATKSPTEQIAVHGVSCLGRCDEPVAVLIDDHTFAGMAAEQYVDLMTQAHAGKHVHPPAPDRTPLPWKVDPYGGKAEYGAVKKFLNEWKTFLAEHTEYRGKTPPELLGELYKLERNLKPDEEPSAAIKALRQNPAARILAELKIADLRGMGGAGFPAGEKWKSVSQAKLSEIDPEILAKCRRENLPVPVAKKYVVCNGDESEPGTFKDRELLLRFPHLVLEGVILGGLTTGAAEGYVYIRHEYHDQIEAVDAAVRDAWARRDLRRQHPRERPVVRLETGLRQPGRIHLRRAERALGRDGRSPRRTAQQAAQHFRRRLSRPTDAVEQRRDFVVDTLDLRQRRQVVRRTRRPRRERHAVRLDQRRRRQTGSL